LGNLIVNVLHVECDTLTSPPNWSSIATDMSAWLTSGWNNILSTTCTFDRILVVEENYPGSTHGGSEHTLGVGGSRTAGDGKLDLAACGLASWTTATRKRYARGHAFLPPIMDSTALASNGTINPTSPYAVAANAFINAYTAGHTSGSTSYTPEIFSRTQVAKADPVFSFPILRGVLDAPMAYLRSRLTNP
jgi:hypothetical protein